MSGLSCLERASFEATFGAGNPDDLATCASVEMIREKKQYFEEAGGGKGRLIDQLQGISLCDGMRWNWFWNRAELLATTELRFKKPAKALLRRQHY